MSEDDLNTIYPNAAQTKVVLIVKQQSHYTLGKITQIDLDNQNIVIDRQDDTVTKTSVSIPLSNVSHLVFGYADEPPRYDKTVTIDYLKVGQDVLVYSESPIAQDADTINASYVKVTEPTRPASLDLTVTPAQQ